MNTGGDWVLPESYETDAGMVRWARLGRAGPPIVLVHGTPYWSYLWRDIAPALARTHTVYVTVPVRLLWGRHDQILPPEYGTWLHERIPHSTLHWVDDAGHLLQEDAPARLTAYLLG